MRSIPSAARRPRTRTPDTPGQVLVFLAAGAVVITTRYLLGLSPLPGRPRRSDATWLSGAVPPRPTRPYRPNLRYWPGWQLAILRWLTLAVLAAAWLAPVVTASVAAVVTTAVTTVALVRQHRHRWAIGPAGNPIRVRVRIGPPRGAGVRP